jgi:imidazole glycerol phosphate synthase glutamine amidotransferase subunit
MKIGLIDYGRGNLHSVEKALARVDHSIHRVQRADEFSEVDVLVLPGVGAFGDAMNALDAQGLRAPLRAWLDEDRPFMGICLGYQLLFASSEESPGVEGLGWLPGRVVRFPSSVGKVPHMGWNEVHFRAQGPLRTASGYYYHVHSFYPVDVPDSAVVCTTNYGGEFASGIRLGNVAAFQFHPEKSQKAGLQLVRLLLDSLIPATTSPIPS